MDVSKFAETPTKCCLYEVLIPYQRIFGMDFSLRHSGHF